MASFIEVRVVRPAVERLEALLTRTGAPAAVTDAVGAGAMPSHADEERAVMTVVGRPPLLRGGHEREQIGLNRFEVEAVELSRVIEAGAHRIGKRRRTVEHRELEQLREPIDVRPRLK